VDAAAAERARKLLTEGARLHDEGKFSEAYVALVAAWAIKQTPSLAKNLADCEVAIGKHRDAAEHLRYIAKSPEAGPEEKQRAQALLDDTLKKIGTYRISVSIDNAEVVLDGAVIGKSPLKDTVYVSPGKHTFEARRDRYEPDHQDVDVIPGSTQIVRLQPVASGPPPDAPTGFDKVRPWILRTGLGLTVIGVALGAGMTVLANKQGQSAIGKAGMISGTGMGPPCNNVPATYTVTINECLDLQHTLKTQSLYANAAVGMFTVGGVAALITAGFWTAAMLTKDQPPFKPLTGLQVTPGLFAGPGAGGAALSGRW
jgi:hypothetical protein